MGHGEWPRFDGLARDGAGERRIQEITMTILPTRAIVLGVVFVLSACGSDTDDTGTSELGGAVGSGGEAVATGGSGATSTGGVGTGGVATGGEAAGGSGTGGAPPVPFDLQGTTWLYLGPWDSVHTLEISEDSVVYADIAGEWSSTWSLTEYDNDVQHFQLTFASGVGTYSPTGSSLSGAYVLADAILTVQLAEGVASYPPVESPGSCTRDGAERIPDCGIYMKQN